MSDDERQVDERDEELIRPTKIVSGMRAVFMSEPPVDPAAPTLAEIESGVEI